MCRFLRTSLWIGLISLFQLQNVDPQEQENLRIQVGVEEVRIDVVVVDSKGRQVTDLTADDF